MSTHHASLRSSEVVSPLPVRRASIALRRPHRALGLLTLALIASACVRTSPGEAPAAGSAPSPEATPGSAPGAGEQPGTAAAPLNHGAPLTADLANPYAAPAPVASNPPPNDLTNPYPGAEATPAELAAQRSAASGDSARWQTAQASFGPGTTGVPCSLLGGSGVCTPLVEGPIVLSDFVTLGGCPDQLYLGAAPNADRLDAELQTELDWLVPVRESGSFGAAFVVPAGSRLVAALRPAGKEPSLSARCVITWTGYRPR